LFVRQSGSHRRFRGDLAGRVRNVTLVAGNKQIPDGTLAGIASQLGLTTPELKRRLLASKKERGR